MTPLARLLARHLPARLVGPALALAYASMIALVLVMVNIDGAQIIYVDVRGQ